MSEHLQSIEKRLSVLEKNIEHIADQLKKSGWIRTSPVPQKSEPTTQPKSDSHSASLLLPIVAAICFVLAGVFIVRLAI